MKNSIAYFASMILVVVMMIGSPAIYAQSTEQDTVPTHLGYAAMVEGKVTSQIGDTELQQIEIGDDIFFNELITTEANASATLSFRDGSSLEIGPNSAVIIDEFIFNPAEGVKTQTITAVVGSFRFVSGMAMPNQNITLNTPSVIMGIRGSTVPFVVGSDGTTAAVPTNGTATFAPRNNAAAAINIQTGNVGVIRPGGQPRTGPAVQSVGRQVVSRTRQVFGARPSIPMVSQQQRTRNAQANQVSIFEQQQAVPTQPSATAIAARQDQSMDTLGITSITLLDNAGVLDAGTTSLSTDQQTVIDNLDTSTNALQVNLDAGIADGQESSNTNHQQGTLNVITGLAETGDVNAVTAATGNAAQADASQAAPAVAAAAANLQNLNADTMTGVIQSAINGLETGQDDVTETVVGSLTATAINNMPSNLQSTIANDVATTITSNFVSTFPTQTVNLAATIINQLPSTPTGGAIVLPNGDAQAATNLEQLVKALAEVIATVSEIDPSLFGTTTLVPVSEN